MHSKTRRVLRKVNTVDFDIMLTLNIFYKRNLAKKSIIKVLKYIK